MAIGDTSNNLKPLVPMLPFPAPDEGVPPLPPFSGGVSPDVSDLMAQLTALLAPAAEPAPQPMGIGGVFKALLQGLPQAVAVGFSEKPGEALESQLKEMRAMNFQREQRAQARKDRLDDFRRQVGVDVVREQIGERRATARERRAYEQQVRLTTQEQAFKTSERQAAAESTFRLAEYDAAARRRLQETSNEFNLKLVELANARDDMARYTTQREKHRAMGIPPNIADEMAQADVKGVPYSPKAQSYVDAWTASEKSFKDQVRKLELQKVKSEIAENLAQAAHARAAASAASAKSLDFTWVDKEAWGMTKDGRMVILDKMSKNPATGEIVDEKGQVVTPLDQRQARGVYMMREAQGMISGAKGVGANMTGSEDRVQAQYWDGIIQNELKAKKPNAEIVAKLRRTAQATPQSAQFIESAITRNGLLTREEMEANIRRIGATGKVIPLPSDKKPFKSSITGEGPIPRGLRAVEEFLAPLGQGLDATPKPPPGFDPRTRRPIGENPVQFPMSEPKPLGLLPPTPDRTLDILNAFGFQHTDGAKPLGLLPDPSIINQFLQGLAEVLDPSYAPNRMQRLNEEMEKSGVNERARKNQAKFVDDIRNTRLEINPTGNLTIDLLLEQVGLLPPGAAGKAQEKR